MKALSLKSERKWCTMKSLTDRIFLTLGINLRVSRSTAAKTGVVGENDRIVSNSHVRIERNSNIMGFCLNTLT